MSLRIARTSVVGLVATAALAAAALTAPAAVAAGDDRAPGAERTAGADRAAERGHDALRAAMAAEVEAGAVGVVGRMRDDTSVWRGTAGVGDRKTGKPRAADDRFRVGSITKTFVATTLLQLEAEGRLDLDDTVERWLPGVVRGNGHDGSRITLRRMLNHTSGIYSYDHDPDFQEKLSTHYYENRFTPMAPRELVAIAMGHAPDFAPGTSWNYSNTNYVLAAMVIEKVTGRPYGEEIERRVVKRAGLTGTTVPTSPDMPRPHSRAYSTLGATDPGQGVHDVTRHTPSWYWGAGDIVSTTEDLSRFHRALFTGKLLPKRQLDEMLTTVPAGDAPGRSYGLGIYPTKLSCGTEVWGHTGGVIGALSVVATTRDGSRSAAFNYNSDWHMSDALLEAAFCGKVPEAPKDMLTGEANTSLPAAVAGPLARR
ncbi:serine hydrolase domain-containing protein [Streptomyces sp. URMC 123]|uniref:serine hydrolase domain-containing protein n=1 Tax=Streptomyces sp. URMC 123 TaxID=3423403 RepID=UPI003F1B1AAC